MTTETPYVFQPQAASMARVIKPEPGYIRRMSTRVFAQTLWVSAWVIGGAVAQLVTNLH